MIIYGWLEFFSHPFKNYQFVRMCNWHFNQVIKWRELDTNPKLIIDFRPKLHDLKTLGYYECVLNIIVVNHINFIRYVDKEKLNKFNMIGFVIAHELKHYEQFKTGKFKYIPHAGMLLWNNKNHLTYKADHHSELPWEQDANAAGTVYLELLRSNQI